MIPHDDEKSCDYDKTVEGNVVRITFPFYDNSYYAKKSNECAQPVFKEMKYMEKMKDGKFSMMLEPYFRNPKFVMNDEFIDKVKEFFDEKEHDNDKH